MTPPVLVKPLAAGQDRASHEKNRRRLQNEAVRANRQVPTKDLMDVQGAVALIHLSLPGHLRDACKHECRHKYSKLVCLTV